MTSDQLMKEIAVAAKGSVKRLPPRFNCKLEEHQLSCVTNGVVKDQSVITSRLHAVPFLVNMVALEEGEELILELQAKKKETKAKARTWKTAVAEEDKKQEIANKKVKVNVNAPKAGQQSQHANGKGGGKGKSQHAPEANWIA